MRKWRVNIVRQWTSGSVPGVLGRRVDAVLALGEPDLGALIVVVAGAARAGAAQESASDNSVPAATSRPALPIAAILSRAASPFS